MLLYSTNEITNVFAPTCAFPRSNIQLFSRTKLNFTRRFDRVQTFAFFSCVRWMNVKRRYNIGSLLSLLENILNNYSSRQVQLKMLLQRWFRVRIQVYTGPCPLQFQVGIWQCRISKSPWYALFISALRASNKRCRIFKILSDLNFPSFNWRRPWSSFTVNKSGTDSIQVDL